MVGCGAAVCHVELDAEVGVWTAGVVARRQDDPARRLVLSVVDHNPCHPIIRHRGSDADPDQTESYDPDPDPHHRLNPDPIRINLQMTS